MSKDVECPYCGAELEINHDDGYGYEEDGIYEQECRESEKAYKLKDTNDWSPYIDGMSDGADECGELIKSQGESK